MTRSITRTYDSFHDARAVVQNLKAAGLTDADISVMAHEDHHRGDIGTDVDPMRSDGSAAGTGATVGATVGGAAGLLTGLVSMGWVRLSSLEGC